MSRKHITTTRPRKNVPLDLAQIQRYGLAGATYILFFEENAGYKLEGADLKILEDMRDNREYIQLLIREMIGDL